MDIVIGACVGLTLVVVLFNYWDMRRMARKIEQTRGDFEKELWEYYRKKESGE